MTEPHHNRPGAWPYPDAWIDQDRAERRRNRPVPSSVWMAAFVFAGGMFWIVVFSWVASWFGG